jgi:uncharacterized phage protein (TIGR01671 family)
MREKEFRGKRIDTGEWAYGYYVIADEKHYIFTGKTGLSQASPAHCLMYRDFERYEVIRETVGQFTGLNDRDGRRIFEGDIVKDQFGNIGAVIYSHHFLDWRIRFYIGRGDLTAAKAGGVRIFDWVYPKMCLKIIGNIHDTPELLKDLSIEEVSDHD